MIIVNRIYKRSLKFLIRNMFRQTKKERDGKGKFKTRETEIMNSHFIIEKYIKQLELKDFLGITFFFPRERFSVRKERCRRICETNGKLLVKGKYLAKRLISTYRMYFRLLALIMGKAFRHAFESENRIY